MSAKSASEAETRPQQDSTDVEEATAESAFDALLREAARVSGHAPVASSPRLRVGSTLWDGRLSVLHRVGEGGMGVVYAVFDAQRQTRVALKTLNQLDASDVYRFKNEFRALADVRHPNLVQLHELFVDNAGWFFTMELVDGERFDSWVRPAGALDEVRLRTALAELVAAVGAIH